MIGKSFPRWRWSLIGVATIVFAIVGLMSRRSSSAAGVDILADATNALPRRRIDGRLSGPFRYKPLLEVQRGANSVELSPRIDAAAARASAAINSAEENLHVRGVAQLLRGSDAAMTLLEDALRVATGEEQIANAIPRSTDVALLVDFSAACAAHATRSHRAHALVPAIAAADRALEIDSRSTVAAWNRAVALEGLGVRDITRAAWDAYLALDADSEWASEARRRRVVLNTVRDEDRWPAEVARLRDAAVRNDVPTIRAIVLQFPTRVVALTERQFLVSWGRAVQQGDAKAAADELLIVSRVADVIAITANDPLLRDVVRGVNNDVASVFASFGELTTVFKRGGTQAVVEELTRLRDRLVRLHSPAAVRFTLMLALRRYEARAHTSALLELGRLERQGDLARYPLSQAQFFWYRGLCEASLGQATHALDSYAEAILRFRSLGDVGAASALELMRADAAEYAGDIEQAWDSYVYALRDLDLHGEARMLDNGLFAAARSSLRRGYPGPAIMLQNQLIERARRAGKRDYLCLALIARCETNARVGRAEAARADCAEARRTFEVITDSATLSRLRADLEVATAIAATSGTSTVAPLSSALEASVREADHFRIARLYLARARAFQALNDEAPAEADLRSAIAEIEEQRKKLASEDFRITWLDSWRAIHEELVLLLLQQGRVGEAFEVADASRARVTLERTFEGSPSNIEAVRRRLSKDSAFVALWSLSDDNVLAWVIRVDGTSVRRFTVRGAPRRIRACLRGFEMNAVEPDTADATLESIFTDVVQPWLGDIRDATTLYIAPDGALADIPFAGLRNGNGTALIAKHTIVIEPSAAVFVARKDWTSHGWTSVLVVENPVSSSAAGELPRLTTTAELHAVNASELFRVVRVIRGTDATPARFLDESQQFDVVHFAGHATDDKEPDGALVLAPDALHPDGLLRSVDITREVRRHGALVVLAACRTSRGRISGEGTRSLARSFLVTGSTTVIGSLWNVDDKSSDLLFAGFYRHLGKGISVGEALRRAQLELATSQPPRDWAGFQVYGGG